MRFQTSKALTVMMLPVLISAAFVAPAVAGSLDNLKSQPFLLSQATQAGELAGVINNISGESVEFAQFGAQPRNITIRQRDINRLGLRAGSRIAVRLNAQGVATSVRLLRPIRALW